MHQPTLHVGHEKSGYSFFLENTEKSDNFYPDGKIEFMKGRWKNPISTF